MSQVKQEERFGRVTGHTLRRSPQPHHFKGQFIITKRTHGDMEYDDINSQFQELVSDGDLHGSSHMVYSLNKQKRWEIPGLLKDSICHDRDAHDDLSFKVLLVERHLDSQGVFKPACTGLYESKTPQPRRLPRRTYAHAHDLHGIRDRGNATLEETIRRRIHELRCTKNRGGKRKVDWRGLQDALRERMRGEEQQRGQEEETMPQLHYEVGYGRPENKYPWRPEMKLNTVTSNKRSASTKQRHKGTTAFYMEDVYDMEGCVEDDLFEEAQSQSQEECYPLEDAIDSGLIIRENHPVATLGEALCGIAKKPKQCKKRRHKKGDQTTVHSTQKGPCSNQATSRPVRVQHKGDTVFDPEGAAYKPLPKTQCQRRQARASNRTRAAPALAQVVQEDHVTDEEPPSVHLHINAESLRPSRLEADFSRAYAEASCRPRKFAVQVSESDTDLDSDPRHKVYLLFEYLTDDATTIECTDAADPETWQVVKKGVHVRMTVYGLDDRVLLSSEHLTASFPPEAIISLQDILRDVQSELSKKSASWNRRDGAESIACSRTRHISLDVPTVKTALGWDCQFSTADKAYREIASQETTQSQAENEVQNSSATSGECGICYESLSVHESSRADVTSSTIDGLEATVLSPCGHCFCNDCWRQYLRSRVKQGVTDITCPEYKCETPVDPVTTMAFLNPAQFHAHYRRCRDTALARSTRHHRCPNALCGRVAQLDSADNNSTSSSTTEGGRARSQDAGMMVRCNCGWLWCTECREEGHWPATCQQAKDYRALMKKALGEEKKPLITHVLVKRCPRCHTRWEKNGGCPSMICGTCQLNFCWLCLRPFTNHDYDSCRRLTVGFESVKLKYRARSKDYILEIAIEHHQHRSWTALKRNWWALKKLASRSAMVHMSGQRPQGFRASLQMTLDIVAATASTANHQPLTWARTKEHLEMMSRRTEEIFAIAAFCHEGNFVLEHLAFLLGSLPRRQRKAKWWRAMLDLQFILHRLHQTLDNLPNIKRAESESTMNRLCRLMHAGKECLRKLAQSMSRIKE
ncbi:uncharacterized protein LOC110974212 [Acanthaster planci]|uniref:RBR-type E3 ubiquitin transferase n=1 Tax=Acanthaster planci TaxID=133434 RepID=A0A8B7XN09_ACAPL|nr:uncharacterized protein LOC110974212 [Acanthaster planci]